MCMKNQKIMKVKVKKLHPDAVIPKYATKGSAGLDLTAVSKEYDGIEYVYDTGLAFEIPEGYVGLVVPRSSICKTNLLLHNSLGVIDADYRGSITLKFHPSEQLKRPYEVGDRIGQLIIMEYPQIELIESDELSETERGTGGYGSTGK